MAILTICHYTLSDICALRLYAAVNGRFSGVFCSCATGLIKVSRSGVFRLVSVFTRTAKYEAVSNVLHLDKAFPTHYMVDAQMKTRTAEYLLSKGILRAYEKQAGEVPNIRSLQSALKCYLIC